MKDVEIQDDCIQKSDAILQFDLLLKKNKRSKRVKSFLHSLSTIVDFIESSSIFVNLRCKWNRQKEDGLSRLHSLELQVYAKSKMAYDILKPRLIDHKLIDIPGIQRRIGELDALFASHELNCSPAPCCLAFDGVKDIGMILEDIERTDLLKDLAKLRTRPISLLTPNGLDYTTKEKVIIDHFTFADGINELVAKQTQFHFKIRETPWAVWERLTAVRWCFKTPFAYWKNKKLRYSSRFNRKESWRRIKICIHCGEKSIL